MALPYLTKALEEADQRDVIVLWGDLPCGLGLAHQVRDDRHVIAVHERLSRAESARLLWHELDHIERGGGCPYTGMWDDCGLIETRHPPV